MYRAIFLTTIFLLTVITVSQSDERGVTPYGDYCRDCTIYGVCKDILSLRESLHALNKYYEGRGYRVGNVFQKGRFIEAEIYKNDRQVDKVLFDRKTGRLRSVY